MAFDDSNALNIAENILLYILTSLVYNENPSWLQSR